MKKKSPQEKYDTIDQAVAVALMTSTAASSKNERMPIALFSLFEDVKAWMGNVHLSIQEIKHRIESWVKKGWAEMLNNSLILTKKGRYHIGRIAVAATS